MAVTLYNEGRVVGLSWYETYLRYALAQDSTTPPASELDLLASSIAMGSSMLLRVGVDTTAGAHYRDIQFPTNSGLCAANTILAAYFDGDAYPTTANSWATRVTSYGQLLSNTTTSSPNGTVAPTGTIPVNNGSAVTDWPQDSRNRLKEYMKVVDGLVIQPGNWATSANQPPAKNLAPNMTQYPRLRLFFSDKINQEFYLLLTGFTLRSVVRGVSDITGSVATANPPNGDFLGPAAFPWASKVIFSVPPSFVNYYMSRNLKRKLPTTAAEVAVTDTAVIDIANDPNTFYTANYPSLQQDENVTEFTSLGDGSAVLTVYQRSTALSPALYATRVTATGTNKLNPVDVVSPGTVKVFDYTNAATQTSSTNLASTLETQFPGNVGMIRDAATGVVSERVSGTVYPVSDTTAETITNGGGAYQVVTKSGTHIQRSLSMGNVSGTALTVSATPTTGVTGVSDSNIYWSKLLESLANNKYIDILEANLKAVKAGLPYNYIKFPNGLRLYISSTAPTAQTGDPNGAAIPVGSIGIGW